MNSYFADTFFFAALLNPKDSAHLWARAELMQLLERRSRVVTTSFVLIELGSSMASIKTRSIFTELLETLPTWKVTVIPCSQRLLNRGLALFATRPDKEWSVVDCISFVVMKDKKIKKALTGDHHFDQAGFHCMFKPASS